MGVTKAFEVTKDCEAIKLVDPRKEGPCEIDGSAVSYMKFKTTEGRLLLKQLKKMAKEDERNAFLQSPLVIGLSDGDVRNWRGQSHGGSKFTRNLIREASITDFSERREWQLNDSNILASPGITRLGISSRTWQGAGRRRQW